MTLEEIIRKKEKLKNRIVGILSATCSGNPENCANGICVHNKICDKEFWENAEKIKGLKRLERKAKAYLNKSNKQKGRRNPSNLGNDIWEIASTLSGCDVFEHELIKGSKWAIEALAAATTLGQINKIFDQRHIEKYGKSKLWHYNKRN